MTLDTSLSLDVVITILVIFGAVWRLDGKIAEVRDKLEGDISDLRRELKGDIAESRQELKNDIAETRQELKNDIQRLEKRIETVETKVDDSNQRLARLEGRFEGREDRFASQSEADSAA
ncbi:MAG: hypothetical protein J4G18_18235 [Anaerolineae bacterium]|nr:hypothetical protein [Anaerolineae bacterium]